MERQARRRHAGALRLAVFLLTAGLLLPACTPRAPVDVNATAVALAHSWGTQTAEALPATPQPLSATGTAGLAAPTPADTRTPTQALSTSTLVAPPPTAAFTQTAEPAPASTPAATPKPAASPTVTSTPPTCPVAVDAALAPGWDYARLGCPKAPAAIVWTAGQPFEHGSMIWMEDTDWIYALNYAGGGDPSQGDWVTGGENWRWDQVSFPNGHDLAPPEGLVEPIRGFGNVWYEMLGGENGPLGWGTEEEKGFCAVVQRFEEGMLVQSTAAGCGGGQFNWATTSGFAPVFIALYDDGSWQRF